MTATSKKRQREWQTIDAMIALYCHDHHEPNDRICAECTDLTNYARQRLEKCPYGDEKPTCAKCPIHCYKPACREQVKEVMRYAGPRLLLRRPLTTIRHLLHDREKPPGLPQTRKKPATDAG